MPWLQLMTLSELLQTNCVIKCNNVFVGFIIYFLFALFINVNFFFHYAYYKFFCLFLATETSCTGCF